MCESSAASIIAPLPFDFDLPTEGYLLPPALGLAVPECSWLLGHSRDSL